MEGDQTLQVRRKEEKREGGSEREDMAGSSNECIKFPFKKFYVYSFSL